MQLLICLLTVCLNNTIVQTLHTNLHVLWQSEKEKNIIQRIPYSDNGIYKVGYVEFIIIEVKNTYNNMNSISDI